jgi:3-oxoacyl-[acyl-carrier protein] reductase
MLPAAERMIYLDDSRRSRRNSASRGITIMGELTGKVAIVTGASKGIGAAIARRFAKAGAAVAVNYSTSKSDADRIVGEITREGGKAVAIQADVGKSAEVKRLFAETQAALGAPSILVNNAGVFSFGSLETATESEFHRQFDTNVLSAILTTKEAVAAFGGNGGSVINLSSISSVNPVPNSVIYSASKSAIDSITKALASELAGRKIRVNAIAPGMTATEGLAAMGIEGETARTMGASLPMGRLGAPNDIADVALFLASDQSAWLTGERISASGGQR